MKGTHSFPVRVYYEDTDAAGIVYYANYLRFAERARTEALRLSGIDQSDLLREHNVGFVVRKCIVEFLKPAMLDDLLTIQTRLHDINRVSMELVPMEVKLVVVGSSLKLEKIPDFVRKAMLKIFNH